jgi:hypothetical protein
MEEPPRMPPWFETPPRKSAVADLRTNNADLG